jgi:hypothetical protein
MPLPRGSGRSGVESLRLAVLAIYICGPGLALANRGPIDNYGCHKDRRQGGYHCHRGVLAGQSFTSKEHMLKEFHRLEREKENRKR